MGFFYSVYPPVAIAQLAFMIWMLIDAHRRQAEPFWFWVILLVPFVGAWAYFFVVKVQDFVKQPGGSLFHRRVSLEELRYRVDQTPTLANHLALAERLMEQDKHDEALRHFDEAKKKEPEHNQVIYGRAACFCALGRPEEALPLLEDLVRRNPGWSDYTAWHLLIEAKLGTKDASGALASCRELARHSPTLHHRCLLAEQLLAGGLHEEARRLLDEALRDHAFAPRLVRRRNGRWVSVAKKLQKQTTLK
jgi:hypothetical protein